jgi:hypothetical protein
MSKNLWDEIEGILDRKENQTYPTPLWIDLTPNGKTLVVIYRNEPARQEILAEAFIGVLGEPEEIGFQEDNPDDLWLLFPHQNLPAPLKDIAERMTTTSLLKYLSKK